MVHDLMRFTFFVVIALTACSKKPAPIIDAGTPEPAQRALPTSSSTISYFEPLNGKCVWRIEDVLTKTRMDLAQFPGTCVGARVAWQTDGTRAIVSFDPLHVQTAGYFRQTSSPPGYADEAGDERGIHRWYLVTTRTGAVEELRTPDAADEQLRDIGLTANGDVIALMEQPIPDGAKTVKSGDAQFDVSTITEGIPVLVHARRRDGANWKRIETKLSSTGWDYGLGVQELEVNRALGPRSDDLLASHAQGDSATDDELAKLKKHAPKKAKTADDGAWIFIGVGNTRVYVWEVTGEFAHTTGLVVANDAPLAELGFTDGDLVALRGSENVLLISASDVGTHARVYEMPTGKVLFKSDLARGVTFWPMTAKPSTHE